MTLKVYRQKRITRADLDSAVGEKVVFLFGDNFQQAGFGGQAKQMRGAPNAIGVPTKRAPSSLPNAYFTDDDLENQKAAIQNALHRIPVDTELVVIPADGLGTGLADMQTKAPLTFAFLQTLLDDLAAGTIPGPYGA